MPVPIEEIDGRLLLQTPDRVTLVMHPITMSEDALELCLALGVQMGRFPYSGPGVGGG